MPTESSSGASSSSNKKNSVWKAGAKGLNKVANAASQVARSAAPGGLSSTSRQQLNEEEEEQATGTFTIHEDNNSSIDDTPIDSTTSTSTTPDATSGKHKKGVFKKTLKKINKAANKVNPLRIPNAMRSTGGTTKLYNEDPNIIRYLGTDEAEDAVLSSVERRSKNTFAGEDGFRPAVEGETPPFGVPTLGNAFSRAFAFSKSGEGGKNADGSTRRKPPSLKMKTQQVMAMQRLERAAMMHKQASVAHFGERSKVHHHRRARTLLDTIGSVHDQNKESEPNAFGLNEADHFRTFDKVFNEDVSSHGGHDNVELVVGDSNRDGGGSGLDEQVSSESLPLLSGNDESAQRPTPSERIWRARQMLVKKQWNQVTNILNPARIIRNLIHSFIHSTLLIAITLFITAWILFYYCGNPAPPEFFPGLATLSWWCNFFGRHILLFELARFCQFIVIDCLVLTTRWVSRTLGPWITIFFIQSKGWPFIVGSWGLWASLLLQGGSKFDYHWLYWTGIEIYSSGNSGSYIISSETYFRVLLAMVLTGVLTALKLTFVSLYFGRRMFEIYKPRLEEILNDIILISEVAELSVASENIASAIGVEKRRKKEPPKEIQAEIDLQQRASRIQWSQVKFDEGSTISRTNSESALDDESTASEAGTDGDSSEKYRYFDSSSSRIPIKDLLDKWEEPVSKRDKTMDATVNDILKFRRALTYMDLDHPFSEAFGLASTRNEMIVSSEAVYNRLMKLSPEPDILSYSVFAILLLQEDGSEDREKRKTLRNLFRPDGDDNLPPLSFVQTCDTIYKRIRYFRASVGNASVIDGVLEQIIDAFFYFTLGLLVLFLLNLNPWPLLVSMSTLLVTASFAVGPSAAKIIEGILLIVGRRPFDIGDRIIIKDSPGAEVPTMGLSWFVEDITLFSTTLRFAASNEIATVSNGSIAAARITNCARSKNATVHTILKFHIKCHQNGLIEKYRKGIDRYVDDRPNVWDSVLFFRCEDIDSNNEIVTYRLAVRSRFTWQIANRVFQSHSDLHKYCISLSFKLDINYDSPNPRSVFYYGGSLVDGGVQDYKVNVLKNGNIDNDATPGLLSRELITSSVRGASQNSLDAEEMLPRVLDTAEEARGREQASQETDDDEMDDPEDEYTKHSGCDGGGSGSNSSSFPPENTDNNAADQDMVFLNLLQQSHPS